MERDQIEQARAIAMEKISELEQSIAVLESDVELALAAGGDNSESEARILELEKQLSSQAEDMEETEEKYLEVSDSRPDHNEN